mmetsp:Transcript_131712/g.227818  ORF Transcript_131712/g.227818 Transcript_131712/m.227818 type:complete len:270 (+) Transcript_131712:131-940(+)
MLYLLKAPFILCQTFEKACAGCTQALNQFCMSSCTGVAKCLEETCGGVCKGIGCVFEGIAKCLGGIVYCFMSLITGTIKFFCSFLRCDQPLGLFVICSVLFNGPAAYKEYESYESCGETRGAMVVGITAVVNILVAIYCKKKVNYMGKSNDPMEDELSPEAAVAKQQRMTPKEVFEKINYMLMYDVTFCLYFFAFSAAWIYTSINLFSNPCDSTGHVLVLIYGPFCSCYCGCFYCSAGGSAALSAIGGGGKKSNIKAADANSNLLTNQR